MRQEKRAKDTGRIKKPYLQKHPPAVEVFFGTLQRLFEPLYPVLALFRNNQSTTAVLLAFYVGLLHLPAMLGWVHVSANLDGAWGGVLYLPLFGWALQNEFFSAITVAAIIYGQAILVNNLADEFRITGDRNWLPGALYALAASSLADFWFLSPPVVAATFIPLALRRTFRVYKKPAATVLIFDAGLWGAVGSLFYPPAIWILIVLFAGINSLRSFKLREQLVCLTGVITPLFLAWTGCFWFDRGGDFWPIQFGQLFNWIHFDIQMEGQAMLKIGLWAAFILSILFSYGIYYYKKLIQLQKYISILYWLLFLVALTAAFRPQLRAEHFFLAMSSMGIFLAMSITAIRRPLLAELIHLAAILGIFLIQFLPLSELALPQLF